MKMVGDFFSFQNGYAFKSKDFVREGKYKIVKIKELKDGLVQFFDDTAEVDLPDNFDFDKYIIRKGDVLFALTGDPVNKPNPLSWVGRVAYYNYDEPALLNQRVCKAIPKTDIPSDFLYYFFRQNREFYRLASKATCSASQANISTKTIEQHNINIPDVENVKKIVTFLKNIDDNILYNNRINRNLSEQAKALFEEELLKFDSVPEGWKKGSLSDIADYLNGLAMQKFRSGDDEKGLPVLKIKELRQGSCDANSELCSLNIKPEYIIHDGDVIFSWSGSLLVDFWCGGECGLNQHLFKVTSKKYDKWFYYAWTLYHLDRFIAVAADKATTMGHIKREELSKAEVLIPDSDSYKRIGEVLGPLYDMIISNRVENRRLATLRDELLPMLMSGKMDVSEVEL